MSKSRSVLSDRLIETVNQMPAKVQRVFILSHYRGLSLREIGEALGLMESEVEALLNCGNRIIYQTVPVRG